MVDTFPCVFKPVQIVEISPKLCKVCFFIFFFKMIQKLIFPCPEAWTEKFFSLVFLKPHSAEKKFEVQLQTKVNIHSIRIVHYKCGFASVPLV